MGRIQRRRSRDSPALLSGKLQRPPLASSDSLRSLHLCGVGAEHQLKRHRLHGLAATQLPGELIPVVQILAQAGQFLFQVSHGRGMGGVGINIFHLARIPREIEQLPLVELVEVDQFVALGADAIVRLHAMVGGVMVLDVTLITPLLLLLRRQPSGTGALRSVFVRSLIRIVASAAARERPA